MRYGRIKAVFVFAVALFAMLLLGGCGSIFGGGQQGSGGDGGGSQNSEVLNDYIAGDITDLSPTTVTDGYSFSVINQFMEGLYRLDADDEPVPAMAESVDISDDKQTYTFHLRDGIQWSNGDPVTSQDFKYAWLRAMNPDTAGSYSFILTDFIEGGDEYASGDGSAEDVAISTPDEQTLEVKLSNPTPFFLSLTAFPTYFPLNEGFVEEQGDQFAQSADSLLANGPYTVEEFGSSEGVKYQKNPDYWDADNVAIDTVDLRVIKEAQTAVNLYESGDLDTAGLTSENVDRYRDDPGFYQETNFETLILYMNNEDKVLGNENIRQAIQRGFDREAYVENILGSTSTAAFGLVPPGMDGPGDQTFREVTGDTVPEYDPQRAKELYEQGVDELGEEPTITINVGDQSTSKDTGTFLQSQLEENLGANVEIKVLPFDSLLEAAGSGDYQISASTWIADYNDPMNFLDLYLSDSGFNYPNYDSARYDELIQNAKTEPDEQRRMELLSEAEQLLLGEDAAIAPVYYAGTTGLIRPSVKNYVTHPYGPSLDYKYASIEE